MNETSRTEELMRARTLEFLKRGGKAGFRSALAGFILESASLALNLRQLGEIQRDYLTRENIDPLAEASLEESLVYLEERICQRFVTNFGIDLRSIIGKAAE